ncbi:ribose 5-phosphate isomerase B [Prolixibacteraceae bacterium JC049]|nr:ribose 5-phosphate isomerase B [Prolixibacteraceae bacterium JC049]
MSNKSIALASDHAGFGTKKVIIEHLEKLGYSVKDFGCPSEESCDYPDFAHPLADAVEKGEFIFGITLCGSGNGISMAANKHQGIRSALCWQVELAQLAREHNDANVCSIPARYVSEEEALAIVDAFLNTEFEGGRHIRRVEKIALK